MKISLKIISLVFVFILAVILIGFGITKFKNPTEAQTYTPNNSKSSAWHRKEVKIKTKNSKLNLNFANLSASNDLIVGVKSINDEQKQKMFIARIFYGQPESEGLKKVGFRPIARIEDYSDRVENLEGAMSLISENDGNSAILVYLELPQKTEVKVNRLDKENLLNNESGSFIFYDGKTENVNLNGPSDLIRELQTRQIKKAVEESGRKLKVN